MAHRSAWDKMVGESNQAYQTFLIYRDMGADRTLRKVIDDDLEKRLAQGKKRNTQIFLWSSKYHWQKRVTAWDNHVRRQLDITSRRNQAKRQIRWLARREKEREQNFQVAQKLRQRAIDLMAHPIVRTTTTNRGRTTIIEPAGWTQRDVATLLKVASELASVATMPPWETDGHDAGVGGHKKIRMIEVRLNGAPPSDRSADPYDDNEDEDTDDVNGDGLADSVEIDVDLEGFDDDGGAYENGDSFE